VKLRSEQFKEIHATVHFRNFFVFISTVWRLKQIAP